MDRTHRWALRSLTAFQRNGSEGQALFGIVQGGAYKDLREESARYSEECLPIEKDCRCYACRHYSRGYLRHLFSGNDPLGRRLAATHNLHFLESLMRQIRMAIREETLDKLEMKWRRLGRKKS